MSSRNNIDDFFKKKLGNTGGGEIPEGFLADINSRLNALDKKKKKRGIWWWMAAGMVAGTGLTWGTMTLLSPEQSKVANNYVGDMPADQSHKQQFVRAGWGNTGNEIPITKNQEPGTGKPVTNPTRPVNNSAEVLTTKTTKKPLNNYAVNPHTGVLKNDVKNNVEGGYRYGNDKKIANGRQENGARNNQNISVLVNAGFAGDTAGTHYGNVNDLNRPNGETDFGESINLTINQDSLSQETVQNSNETPPADSLPGNNPISSSPAPNGTKYGTGSKFTLAVAFGVQYVKNTFPGDTMSYYFTKRKSQEKPILGFDASVLVSRKFNN
ncbi:MAG TPA: hypothetical protein VD905_20040, partial [Flavobacteriales bacterium]|nr:hypothetical protein [Flavobacteriales bacterium]